MKILVVSLLRLGDALIAAPVIKGFRDKYSDGRIDFLVNEGVERIFSRVGGNGKCHVFPRGGLQESLARADRPVFESVDEIKGLIDTLSTESYDLVVNLTQTRLSGYICGMIEARQKLGLALSHLDRPVFGNSWFKFMNDVAASGGQTAFHFSDMFYLGCGLPKGAQFRPRVKREVTGKLRVLLQPSTSDAKKNWGIERWVRMLAGLRTFSPREFQVGVLGAPSEREDIAHLIESLKNAKMDAEAHICDLDEVYERLSDSDLLITGDTSIKHLAAMTNIDVVEIALGSSVFGQTGVYSEDNLIIAPATECAPCPHSSSCSKPSHLCAADLQEEVVASAIHHYIERDWSSLHKLADETIDVMKLARTSHLPNGFWFAERLGSKFVAANLNATGELCAWRAILDKEHVRGVGGTGSEGLALMKFWLKRLGATAREKLQIVADQIENETMKKEEELNNILNRVSKQIRASAPLDSAEFLGEDIQKELETMERDLGLGRAITDTLKDGDNVFWSVRSMQMRLNEIFSQQSEKKRVIRTFRNQLRERMV